MTHEAANLFNGETAQGNQIEGRVQLTARPSIAEIFGITDFKTPPSGEAFDNIMLDLRVDGGTPMLEHEPTAPIRNVFSRRGAV
jgi:hypothetical protein